MIEEFHVPQHRAADDEIGPNERFCVYQFFCDDAGYEMVRHAVPIAEATKAAKHYTMSVGARIGTTVRVIITDGGDMIVFEWKHGEGVVFPPVDPNAKP